MLRVGLIGVGGMGGIHLRALKAYSSKREVAVIAIADVRPEQLKKGLEIWPKAKTYDDGHALIREADIDVLWITAPSYLHADFIVEALEKGLHVFSEKPLCLTLDDLERVLDAARASNRKTMVGQVVRFYKQFEFISEIIRSKKYGDLRSVTLNRISMNPIWGWDNWFNDEKRSGSVVLDLHIHDVDILRRDLGDPEIVHVSGLRDENGMITQVQAHLRFGEVNAFVEGVWHVGQRVPFIPMARYEFDKATILYMYDRDDKVYVYQADGGVEVFDPTTAPKMEGGSGINLSGIGDYYFEDEYFLDCILDDKENTIATFEEGAKSVLVCLKEKGVFQ